MTLNIKIFSINQSFHNYTDYALSFSGQAEVCLKLMLERNNQQFNEAHSLSCAALDLLDRLYLDWKFSASIMRRDEIPISKHHDAIEHLRLIMTEYHAPAPSIEIRGSFASPRLFQFLLCDRHYDGFKFYSIS